MRKIVFSVLLTLCVSLHSFAQSKMHIVYILHDNSTDVLKLEEGIKNAIEEYKNDNYIVFYSDASPLEMTKKNYKEETLMNAIFNNNSTYSIAPQREVNALSTLFEKNYGGGGVVLECFVSEDFFDNNYQNSVVANFLIVNGLHNDTGVTVRYHLCGGKVKEEAMAFTSRYNIQNKTTLVK